MTDTTNFDGSIPRHYDRYLGPLLFEPYAADLAGRLHLSPGAKVLELACGTGIVTRHLLKRLPATGQLVATDLSDAMLAFARGRTPADPRLEWRQADAAALPFHDRSFNTVVCQFGIMFFPDKPTAAREVRRVLVPGGLFIFSVWDSSEHNVLGRIIDGTIRGFFPTDPPDFTRIPFSYADPDVIRGLLTAADFTDLAVEEVSMRGESPSALEAAMGFILGNPIATAIRERGTVAPEKVIQAAAAALAAECGDRPLRVPMRALMVSARAIGA
jgi:SAM-dependent methyltransferase